MMYEASNGDLLCIESTNEIFGYTVTAQCMMTFSVLNELKHTVVEVNCFFAKLRYTESTTKRKNKKALEILPLSLKDVK